MYEVSAEIAPGRVVKGLGVDRSSAYQSFWRVATLWMMSYRVRRHELTLNVREVKG